MAVTKIRDDQAAQNVDLTSEVVNTLPVTNGGTGVTTLTGLVKGAGTSALTAATAGTDYGSPDATAASPTNKNLSSTTNVPTQKVYGQWAPVDYGFISWSFDPAIGNSSSTIVAAGTMAAIGLKIPVATTITNVLMYVVTAGATFTSGQNFAALYQGGNLLAATADQSTNWTSTGLKTMALSSAQSVTAGMVYVAYYANATTLPVWLRSASTLAPVNNMGLSAGGFRAASANTGLTTAMPATMGTQTSLASALWSAVS